MIEAFIERVIGDSLAQTVGYAAFCVAVGGGWAAAVVLVLTDGKRSA